MIPFNKLMELVEDYGVCSLRAGIHEARAVTVGGNAYQLADLRQKRQESKERFAKALFALCNEFAAPAGPPWCCEKGEALNTPVCPECDETSSAYSAAAAPAQAPENAENGGAM